ncbi:hypothetical protein [Paraflavitalea speifideaquila]|uniref:hypothetical protein n=1 Tax=Paraflavitalea speifideaquila TaxID=3076558 RepID=UPI0028ED41D3|nr:hypothetical protein [Paraflavitalea speifideiaquila]
MASSAAVSVILTGKVVTSALNTFTLPVVPFLFLATTSILVGGGTGKIHPHFKITLESGKITKRNRICTARFHIGAYHRYIFYRDVFRDRAIILRTGGEGYNCSEGNSFEYAYFPKFHDLHFNK